MPVIFLLTPRDWQWLIVVDYAERESVITSVKNLDA